MVRKSLLCILLLLPIIAMRCAAPAQTTRPAPEKTVKTFTGGASYYGHKFHGKKTASGERFDMNGFTAAHRTLPFGTRVRVTNLSNGLSVIVRINDRGPHKHTRVIDVSYAAAQRIGMVRTGLAQVKVEVLK